MHIDEFDYYLPETCIAQHPIEPRDASRLLVLDKKSGVITHRHFYEIGEYLNPGDVLVINDTKVLPARLYAKKPTGAVIELVLLRQLDRNHWQTLVRPGKKALPGTKLLFDTDELTAEVEELAEEGTRILRFNFSGDFFAILDRIGQMPLPPYIKEKLQDGSRYQPVYARELGSAAAPTAGLHFTERLLQELEAKGVIIAKVLLHVGLGTFRPVKVDVIEEHKMHAEYYEVPAAAAARINAAKAAGGRIISVGTTSTRTLETVATPDGIIEAKSGYTESYIFPGYQFKAVDALITNFHLPKSTLLMLVSALAGREHVLAAYEEAIRTGYRFFSFGDAMLVI